MCVAEKTQLQTLHRENINVTIPSELTTTAMLIDVLSGDQPPPSESNNTKKINNSVEAVIHTIFLPPLKGASLESCKSVM